MNQVINPLDICEHHKESMAEDFLHQQRTRLGNIQLDFNEDIFNLALNDLQDRVFSMGGRQLSEYGLPQPIMTGWQGIIAEK